ncbi:hypothetical protein JX265_013254 [Neoarthrinium moseri]|uniref:Uncharacterized protein n=1 Tax=Neoarthrinium moseri TaxID=1658444 RepID=A0A9Q0AHT9_9PEZI|nr:hypothetical protein JX265_013254 [Neoarthrinium moseri]
MAGLSVLLSVLYSLALAADSPNKTTVSPPFNYTRIDADLRFLPPPDSTFLRREWISGIMPQACRDFAILKNLTLGDFSVYEFVFADCARPWVMCQHKESSVKINDLAYTISTTPVLMRQRVRHYMAVGNTHDGAAATWSKGDIAFRLDFTQPSIVLHETSHGMDHLALNDFGSPFSATDAWRKNIAADAAVVSDYSNVNWKENFAESTVIAIYDRAMKMSGGGGVEAIQGSWRQVYHAYTVVQAFLGDQIWRNSEKKKCWMRYVDSDVVFAVNGSKFDTQQLLLPTSDVQVMELPDHIQEIEELLDEATSFDAAGGTHEMPTFVEEEPERCEPIQSSPAFFSSECVFRVKGSVLSM